MGLRPSSLYRKFANESMTFEELQKCIDFSGVSLELRIDCPDGGNLGFQANRAQLADRIEILQDRPESTAYRSAIHYLLNKKGVRV